LREELLCGLPLLLGVERRVPGVPEALAAFEVDEIVGEALLGVVGREHDRAQHVQTDVEDQRPEHAVAERRYPLEPEQRRGPEQVDAERAFGEQ
jgi:hypothetical protein